MSPLSAPAPCPHLIEDGTFVFCAVYKKRPEECVNHSFHARVCPVGLSVLGITDPEALRARIDLGWEMCERGKKLRHISLPCSNPK